MTVFPQMILLPNYHQVAAMIARRRAIVKLLDNKFQMHVSATKIFPPSDSIGAAEDVEFQRVNATKNFSAV
ncbi:MAG: hypothetical protein IKD80_03040 [Selenomonadaceae bacterium]|nr:hypothetical protein [Selenomonadaceae bacterium]